jgi:o-succinylbenzoate synthase
MTTTGEVFIERAEIHVVAMPLRFRFETSFGVQTERIAPILVLHGSDSSIGLAEGVMDSEWPLYREETVEAAVPLVTRMLDHFVVGRPLDTPGSVADRFAHLRGNRMAKAMIEMAVWDLYARANGRPLRDLLGGTGDAIATGVSLGIQPSIDDTVALVGTHVDLGYKRIKLKIKPGWDLEPLRAIRSVFPELVMTADANSAYTLADVDHLHRIDEVGLDYMEQPLAWDDIADHAELARSMATPLCLDESIVSVDTTRLAMRLGAARVINMKVGRVGGHGEALAIEAIARAHSVPLWCGGMLETGVGRAHNIHLATLPGFTKPGDVSSGSRYWEHDVIVEPLECVDGMMAVPPGAGIGVTLDDDTVSRLRVEHVVVTGRD